jgi:hypothetical protein
MTHVDRAVLVTTGTNNLVINADGSTNTQLSAVTGTSPLQAIPVTIPSGGSLAPAVDLTGKTLVRIITPATMTGTQLTFAGSETEGGTYTNVYDRYGVEYSVVSAASRRIQIPPADLVGNCWLKVRSGTAATPTVEGAARTVTLLVRPV